MPRSASLTRRCSVSSRSLGSTLGGFVVIPALLSVLTVVAACSAPSASTPPPTVTAALRDDGVIRMVPAVGSRMGYVVRVPAGYDRDRASVYPTVVFLHGLGEVGSGSAGDLAHLESVALPQLAARHRLPPSAQGMIILAPQTSKDSWDVVGLHGWLAATLPEYRIDRDRLYLTGVSMGGGGVVGYVDTYGEANEFAAVLPVSGDWQPQPPPLATASCAHLAGTPLWAFVGELDPTVPHQLSVNLVNYLNARCTLREPARITVFLSTFHNAWDKVYDLSGMEPGSVDAAFDPFTIDPYAWLLAHRRSTRIRSS